MGKFEIEVVTDGSRFGALANEWSELIASSCNATPFLTWEWLYCWWQNLRGDRDLHLVLIREDQRLIAAVPLARRPARFRRLILYPVLEFIGSGDAGSDYVDVLVRRGYEDCVVGAVLESISRTGTTLELRRVANDSWSANRLANALLNEGWHARSMKGVPCPRARLPKTFDEYLRALGPSHRSNVRRRIRKLRQSFSVELSCLRCSEDVGAGFAKMVELHFDRRDRLDGSTAFHTQNHLAFHRDFATRMATRGVVRLFLLRLDEEAVAAVYGWVYNDCFYFFQSGFNTAYQDYSVGLVSVALVIEALIEEGVGVFDFLHGDESYKYLWSDHERQLCDVDLLPPGGQLAVHSLIHATKRNLKGLYRSFA